MLPSGESLVVGIYVTGVLLGVVYAFYRLAGFTTWCFQRVFEGSVDPEPSVHPSSVGGGELTKGMETFGSHGSQ